MYPSPRSHRPLIMGMHGAVGANHPLATQAGLDVLRTGGNAIDAAVAIAMTLSVVEPSMSGLGGDSFYHVFIADGGVRTVYNGTGAAPRRATPAAFGAGMDVRGPRSASVPGALAGLGAMHAAHGSMPWAGLVEPAAARAEEGFGVTHTYRNFAQEMERLLAADARSAAAFLSGGRTPAIGEIIRQPALAETLRAIASEGPESFYRGTLARRLARGLRDVGALIDEDDLAACRAEVQAPISVPYRGYEIWQTPLNSTGFVMLEMLRIAAHFDIASLSTAQRIHVLVEAKKRAFLDRERYGADPAFFDVDIGTILSAERAAAHAATIRLDHAADIPLRVPETSEGNTTYFCVVDSSGNAVSGIQSINSAFGSGVTAGDTGVLMNNRMAYWHLDETHPNRLQPGKRVRHTMNAPMVFRDGKLWALLGTPGADNQVQVNTQVLTAMIDLGRDPQTAIELPRWTSSQPGQGANWPHEGDGALTIERDVGEPVLAELARLGHVVKPVGHLEGPCAMQAIRVLDNGVRMAASDTRRDGWAGAY